MPRRGFGSAIRRRPHLLMEMKDKPLGQIKQVLGENYYSNSEIRLVQVLRNHLAAGEPSKKIEG